MTYKPEPAESVTYSCGHEERIGGNLADPAAVYAEAAGLMTFRKDEGLCTRCQHPEMFK